MHILRPRPLKATICRPRLLKSSTQRPRLLKSSTQRPPLLKSNWVDLLTLGWRLNQTRWLEAWKGGDEQTCCCPHAATHERTVATMLLHWLFDILSKSTRASEFTFMSWWAPIFGLLDCEHIYEDNITFGPTGDNVTSKGYWVSVWFLMVFLRCRGQSSLLQQLN